MSSPDRPDDPGVAPRCPVSVIIRAFNEEKNICAAIESSLAALADTGGEVILADSCSSDRTVELASRYPIRIVQLANPRERCRGAGTQLGYQHSRGEYVYILDGDMRMIPGFLPHALAFLARHPEAAGVGGRHLELDLGSLEFRERILRKAPHMTAGEVDRLDAGGLYRRRAIEESGYLADRNLPSYEELDLAVRLRTLGWKLWRIPVHAITHNGHDAPPYAQLARRWRSGYVCGLGALIRATAGERRLRLLWRGAGELRIYLAVLAWWCLLLSVAFWPLPALTRAGCLAALASAPVLLMLWHERSLARAVHSVVSFCFNAAGLVRGLLRDRLPAGAPIPSRIIKEPPSAVRPRREQWA